MRLMNRLLFTMPLMAESEGAVSELAILKARADVVKAEIDLKRRELESIQAEISKCEWKEIEWTELEDLLKSEFAGRSYRECPRVCASRGDTATYCFITDSGQLQVGPYFYNDRFPRGSSLFVHSEMKPWGA